MPQKVIGDHLRLSCPHDWWTPTRF